MSSVVGAGINLAFLRDWQQIPYVTRAEYPDGEQNARHRRPGFPLMCELYSALR